MRCFLVWRLFVCWYQVKSDSDPQLSRDCQCLHHNKLLLSQREIKRISVFLSENVISGLCSVFTISQTDIGMSIVTQSEQHHNKHNLFPSCQRWTEREMIFYFYFLYYETSTQRNCVEQTREITMKFSWLSRLLLNYCQTVV